MPAIDIDHAHPEYAHSEHADLDTGRDWRSKPEQHWSEFDRNEAYLDTRPVGGPFDPTLDYGHPDWREPESDDEAASRLAHLKAERDARPPQTPELRERTPVEEAVLDAGIDAELADRARDPDPALWTHYRELSALERLEPLPTPELDEHQRDEPVERDEQQRDDDDEYGEDEL